MSLRDGERELHRQRRVDLEALDLLGDLDRLEADLAGLRCERLDALEQLAAEYPEAARLVELRFLVGLANQEAARIMGITRRRADGLWAYARAWLRDAVQKKLGANDAPNSPE